MTEESSATHEAAAWPPPSRSAWDVAELALLQLGLLLLAVYFSLGVVTIRAYSWPLLVGPGPFFPLFCLYLATQLQRRARHLYGLVRFATVYSVPYATIALIHGHLSTDMPLHVGDLPPILLALTLMLRLRAWRRLFDTAPDGGLDERLALLIELFLGVGACSVVLTGLSHLDAALHWARSFPPRRPDEFFPAAVYMVFLLRLLLAPALVATIIGGGLYRSRGANGWVRAAVAFVVVMSTVHGLMQWFFAKDLWSRLSAATWTVVLLGFAGWVLHWHRAHRPAPLPGAPTAF
ncbi:MAG: hypothetical protein IPG17_11470 [Sandaracinaceae bacterium]|nr:hypothetical protein [Sandaracinaceae bacterium]